MMVLMTGLLASLSKIGYQKWLYGGHDSAAICSAVARSSGVNFPPLETSWLMMALIPARQNDCEELVAQKREGEEGGREGGRGGKEEARTGMHVRDVDNGDGDDVVLEHGSVFNGGAGAEMDKGGDYLPSWSWS